MSFDFIVLQCICNKICVKISIQNTVYFILYLILIGGIPRESIKYRGPRQSIPRQIIKYEYGKSFGSRNYSKNLRTRRKCR